MKTTLPSDQKSQPYFYTKPALVLSPALPDVTEDAKKRATAEALMAPVNVDGVKISDSMRDNHFTQEIFAEPVITDLGDTYEREKIAEWLVDHDTNPPDNEKLENKKLRPNKDKLKDVNQLLDEHPALRDSDELYLPRGWAKELEQACVEGKLDVIKRWCDRDRRLGSWTFAFEEKEYQAYQGKTMLHLACAKGTVEAVNHLITIEEKRAEGLGLLLLLKKDSTDKLPIHYAMTPDRDPRLMRQLASQMGKHLADVPAVDLPTPTGEKLRQMTALHLAAMNNDVETLKTLLARKVDLTIKDSQGNTALHAAVACGAIEAIALLIEAGASAEVENDAHQTPEIVGVACDQTAAVAALQKSVAELAKKQQGQLQQAGPVGLALLQMQQMMMQLQTVIKTQAAEIKELRATIQEQDKVIKQQQAEQIDRLAEGMTMESSQLRAELQGQRTSLRHVKKQLDHVTTPKKRIHTWEVMKYINTPHSLRNILIDELPKNPLIRKIRVTLFDEKESKSEYKADRILNIRPDSIAILQDGQIVSAQSSGSLGIQIWDGITGNSRPEFMDNNIRTFKVVGSPDGKLMIGSHVNRGGFQVTVYKNIATRTPITSVQLNEPINMKVTQIVFLPNDKIAVSFLSNQMQYPSSIAILDIATSATRFIRIHKEKTYGGEWLDASVLLALPNGQLVSDDSMVPNTLKIWNTEKLTCVTTLIAEGKPTCLVAFPDGRFASTDGNSVIQIWDITKNSCVTKLTGTGKIQALAVLPNGQLVCGGTDGSIKIWDAVKKTCVTTLIGHTNAITTLTVLPEV